MPEEYSNKDRVDALVTDIKILEAGRTANHEEIAVLRSEFLGHVKSINEKLNLISSGQTPMCIQEQERIKSMDNRWSIEMIAIREDISRIDNHVTWIWRTVGGALILAISAEIYKLVTSHFASLLQH